MTEFGDTFWDFLNATSRSSAISNFLRHYLSDMPLKRPINHLNLDAQTGELTYLAQNKASEVSYYDYWTTRYRQGGKPARIIRGILPDMIGAMFNDEDYEIFTNEVKAFVDRRKGTFYHVTADEIPHWYHEDNYEPVMNTGSLMRSCMRYPSSQRLIQFYTRLRDYVSMLTFRNGDDKLLGRALVWTVDGVNYLDRIYGSDSTMTMFKQFAREHGWYTKAHQSYDSPTLWINPETEEEETINLRIPMDFEPDWNDFPFPYMDTFKYINFNKRALQNYGRNVEMLLDHTEGSYSLTNRGTRRLNSCEQCSRHMRGTYDLIHQMWEKGEDFVNLCDVCAESERQAEETPEVIHEVSTASLQRASAHLAGVGDEFAHAAEALETTYEALHNWFYRPLSS